MTLHPTWTLWFGPFGLTKEQYNAKYPTIKDLVSVWKALPQHSSRTTVPLDDSVDKAQRQPDNHICLVEYTSKLRAQDLKQHRDSLLSVASTDNSVSSEAQALNPAFDSLLLAVVGILDAMREKDDVASWLREGGLRIRGQPKDSTPEDDLAALLSTVTLEGQESTPKPTGPWFEDPEVLEYWTDRGKAALEALQIPIQAGITR